MYEPAWAAMAEAQRQPLKKLQTQGWDEGYDAYGESPWPGAKALTENSYITYKEQNVSDKGVEDAKSGSAHLTGQPFLKYHIRKF